MARSSPPPSSPATTPPSVDQGTFDAVYQRYVVYIREFVRQDIDARDVEDLVQESLVRIYFGLFSCDLSRRLKPWIKTIVRRVVRDYLLCGRTTRERLYDKDTEAQEPRADSEELLGTLELLGDLMASLNPRQREMLVRNLQEGETIDEIAEGLGLTMNGGSSLLRVARAKIEAAVRRHEARERRVLGGRSMFLFPCGLALRLEAWLLRARSTLGRAFAAIKATAASGAASAGVILSLGVLSLRGYPSAPPVELTSPVAVSTEPAAAPPSDSGGAAALASGSSGAAPPPVSSTKRSAGPSPSALPDRDATAERSSLDRIRTMLAKDPTAALAALELHKKRFVHEQFRTDRGVIEASARANAK